MRVLCKWCGIPFVWRCTPIQHNTLNFEFVPRTRTRRPKRNRKLRLSASLCDTDTDSKRFDDFMSEARLRPRLNIFGWDAHFTVGKRKHCCEFRVVGEDVRSVNVQLLSVSFAGLI